MGIDLPCWCHDFQINLHAKETNWNPEKALAKQRTYSTASTHYTNTQTEYCAGNCSNQCLLNSLKTYFPSAHFPYRYVISSNGRAISVVVFNFAYRNRNVKTTETEKEAHEYFVEFMPNKNQNCYLLWFEGREKKARQHFIGQTISTPLSLLFFSLLFFLRIRAH